MVDITNRRQFERLELTERAVAVNDRGVRLGPVTQAGGGGMLVVAADSNTLVLLPVGKRLRVTIVEPDLGTSNTMDVEVMYHRPDSHVGMQFVNLREEELS